MPDPVRDFRVVIVGAGRIAAQHIRAIDSVPGVELVALVDPDTEAVNERASGRGIVVAPDLASALAAASADAAIVATPTSTHVRIASEALDSGLHVLVEKPVAPSREALRSLVARARSADRVLVSGQVVRFLPTVTAARGLVLAGAVGDIEQVVERRVEHRPEPESWWSDTEDFLLHHWGSHSIDLILDLLGVRVKSVFCRGGSGVPGFDGIDSVDLLAELVGGGRISLAQSFSSRHPLHDLLVIGKIGTLLFTGYESVTLDGATVYSGKAGEVLAEGFREQLADFVAAARDGRPARAAASTVDGCLAVLEAASRSLASGSVESVG